MLELCEKALLGVLLDRRSGPLTQPPPKLLVPEITAEIASHAQELSFTYGAVFSNPWQEELADRLANVREALVSKRGKKLKRYLAQSKQILKIVPNPFAPPNAVGP